MLNKVLAAEGDRWIHVTGIEKMVEKDSFSEGVDPLSTQTTLSEGDQGVFNSPESMLNALNKKFGLSTDLNDWGVMEGEKGRLLYQNMEDENGMEVSKGEQKYKEWEAGRIDLYAATWDVYVQFVSNPYEPEADELAQVFKIQKI